MSVSNEAALAAYLDQIQALLCSPRLTDRERNNAIAGHTHMALLYYGGGYTDVAHAERERGWKAVCAERRPVRASTAPEGGERS